MSWDGFISSPKGSPGMFSSLTPIECNAESADESLPAVSPPMAQLPEVACNLLEVSVRVLQDGTKRQSITCDQAYLDKIRTAHSARIVMVTISYAMPREDGQQAWLIVERKTVDGPTHSSEWPALLLESTG